MAKVTNLSKLSEQSVPQAALKLKKKKVAPQHLHKSHIYKSQNHWEFRKKNVTSNANLAPVTATCRMFKIKPTCLYASSPLGSAIHPKTTWRLICT